MLGDTARGREEARQSYAHRTVVGGGEGGLIHRGTGCLRRLVGRLDLGGVGLGQRALLGRHYVGDG